MPAMPSRKYQPLCEIIDLQTMSLEQREEIDYVIKSRFKSDSECPIIYGLQVELTLAWHRGTLQREI